MNISFSATDDHDQRGTHIHAVMYNIYSDSPTVDARIAFGDQKFKIDIAEVVEFPRSQKFSFPKEWLNHVKFNNWKSNYYGKTTGGMTEEDWISGRAYPQNKHITPYWMDDDELDIYGFSSRNVGEIEETVDLREDDFVDLSELSNSALQEIKSRKNKRR